MKKATAFTEMPPSQDKKPLQRFLAIISYLYLKLYTPRALTQTESRHTQIGKELLVFIFACCKFYELGQSCCNLDRPLVTADDVETTKLNLTLYHK